MTALTLSPSDKKAYGKEVGEILDFWNYTVTFEFDNPFRLFLKGIMV